MHTYTDKMTKTCLDMEFVSVCFCLYLTRVPFLLLYRSQSKMSGGSKKMELHELPLVKYNITGIYQVR